MSMRFALLTLLLSLLSLPCYADFTLVPGVDMRMEYNDNIYLASDNEEDDLITTLSPNISMTWETSRLDVSLFASVAMEKYLDNTDEDRIGAGESNQASSLTALARLYRDVFFLSITDSYQRVPIDEGGRGGENNRNVNLTDSNTLTINPYLNFPLMKGTQMRLGYSYTYQWYEEEDGDDYISHLYSASLTNELSPRVTMTLSGSYKEYRPRDADDEICNWFGCVEDRGGRYDYDQESVSVGLSYQATERLQLNGTFGHTWLDYDVKDKGDTEEWLVGADYEITSNYSVGTEYRKSVDISVEDGVSKTNRYSAYLRYDDRFIVDFTLFSRSSEYVEINRDDDSYGGALSGELPFNDRTGITGLLRYENFDRTGLDEEEFDRYATRFSLYYETRLGRVSTGYIYNLTDYNRGGDDYYNNIVFISASLRF